MKCEGAFLLIYTSNKCVNHFFASRFSSPKLTAAGIGKIISAKFQRDALINFRVCPTRSPIPKTKMATSSDSPELTSSTNDKSRVQSPYGVPLPPKNIQVLSEEDIGGRDLLIVGDVHGCYDELKELVDTNDINNENTCIIFVGDLVNKGPMSFEVIEYVMDNSWYSVRGNHDEISLKEQMKSATGETPPQKFEWVIKLTKKNVDWILGLPYAIHIPSRQIAVVHAGLLPDTSLEDQTPDYFLHMRSVTRSENQWEWNRKYDENKQLWGEVWSGPEHVYFGHDAKRKFQEHAFATGLDTGCVYGNELTAIYPLSRHILKVKSHQPLKKKKAGNS